MGTSEYVLVWIARVLLALAIAAQIGYLMLHYRAASFDTAFWFSVGAMLAFSVLMVFGGQTFAGLLRVGLGFFFLFAAFYDVRSCVHAGYFKSVCAPLMKTVGPFVHAHAMLPAIPARQFGAALTVSELVLGVLLVLGLGSRFISWLAAMFLLAYGVVVATAGGVAALLQDCTPVLCAGALLLAAIGPSFLGLDRARRPGRERDPFLIAFDEMHERGIRAWPARLPAERPLARTNVSVPISGESK